MPSKWYALMLAYRQADYIESALRAVRDHVDGIVVMHTSVPFTAYNADARRQFGGDDGTAAILAGMQDSTRGMRVLDGAWNDEEAMRNDGIAELRRLGATICLIVDADEFYEPSSLMALKHFVEENGETGNVFWCRYVNCYRRADYIVDAPRLRLPVAVTIAEDSRFVDRRVPSGRRVDVPEDIQYWHMGYVLPDARMWEKIRTFSHAASVPDDWFEAKWLRWTPETKDLCRRKPGRWPRTIRINPAALPPVLHTHPYVKPWLATFRSS